MSEGFSNKEMLTRIMEQNEASLITQTQLLHRATSVDNHLEKLNSKVATHEGKINGLETEHTKTKAYATAVMFIGTVAWSFITFIIK